MSSPRETYCGGKERTQGVLGQGCVRKKKTIPKPSNTCIFFLFLHDKMILSFIAKFVINHYNVSRACRSAGVRILALLRTSRVTFLIFSFKAYFTYCQYILCNCLNDTFRDCCEHEVDIVYGMYLVHTETHIVDCSCMG